MVDLHCHILPGLDDGPADIAESLAMAATASADGISDIVASPHVAGGSLPAGKIRAETADLNRRLAGAGIPVTIHFGADVSALLEPSLIEGYTISGTPYVLIEFPHTHMPGNSRDLISALVRRGLRPIITHPERNPSVVRDPDLVSGLLEAGSLVQITAGSLTGDFGPDVRECCIRLLRKGDVDIMATDAHSNRHRPPVLSRGLKLAERLIGRDAARRLVADNPAAVLRGARVDVQ